MRPSDSPDAPDGAGDHGGGGHREAPRPDPREAVRHASDRRETDELGTDPSGSEHPAQGHDYGYDYGADPDPRATGDGEGLGNDGPTGATPTSPRTTTSRDGLTASAAIRPLPAGFERPDGEADPRRRRADRLAVPDQGRRPRGLLLGLGIGALVVVLALAGAGIFLVARVLSPGDEAPAASGTAAPSASVPSSSVEIAGIRVGVTSMETALPAVGDTRTRVTPESGEFIAIVLTVENSSDRAIAWNRSMDLVTTDGVAHPADAKASDAYLSSSESTMIISPGKSAQAVLVYDVPIGSVPQEGRITLPVSHGGTTGTLPLG